MSSFKFLAKDKETGQTVKVQALDDFYGRHEYGYCDENEPGIMYTESEFEKNFERLT